MNRLNSVRLISAIVPVGARQNPMEELYADYKIGLQSLGAPFEVIFVLDGPQPKNEAALSQLASRGEPITIVSLSRCFGEATAIMIGFEHATGDILMSLPAYRQVQSDQFVILLSALESADVAIGCRTPRASRWFQTVRRRSFHGLLQWVTGLNYNDLGCNVRAMRRKVLEEIRLYGDQDRFLPVLAERQGFRVREVAVRQSQEDRHRQTYTPRSYTRGFLDIFSIFFLVRFTKRPLRFFGMIGVAMLGIGLLELAYLIVERFVFRVPLADRPALLVAALLIVLGVQVFALGLLGELIIFTHAGGSKDYQVDRVVQFPPAERLASPANRQESEFRVIAPVE
jgi:glycosyltransferase involved in cell wall biosynthesis